ncbi:MAG: DNA starvation/stationary phase protection protein [Alphaproteobacteria bacterium]|nr:DNA starvation/stationary phase protection protein [Alphaproteobacteria bacterium]
MSKKEKNVVGALSKLLADSYILHLKTQNYHWNVTGPSFNSLHTLFQLQYEDLALANDLIAERIRALGEKAPGSYAAFVKVAAVKEENGDPNAAQMLKNLVKDQEALVKSAEAVLQAAEEIGDEPTVDLAIQRQQVHQKNHWMLKAHLE